MHHTRKQCRFNLGNGAVLFALSTADVLDVMRTLRVSLADVFLFDFGPTRSLPVSLKRRSVR